MATLSVAILGLNRVSASVGLALRRYMSKGGKYQFQITGYDYASDVTKKSQKMGAIDRSERRIFNTVKDADIVIMALSYEEVEDSYKAIKEDLRDGVVILDFSPLKTPSLMWGAESLSDEHHIVGATPIVNPRYLYVADNSVEQAQEDLFDDSAILLTPSASCIKEAVDLAYSFAQILGSKPRFLDPLEHDTSLTQTSQLPRVLGTLLFYNLMNQANWEDLQWFTNPAFGALTRPLFDTHPDALRDEFLANRETLGRMMDDFIGSLQEFRATLRSDDKDAIEAVTVAAAEQYEQWVNNRYRADWDAASKGSETNVKGTIMQGLLGGTISKKLFGDNDDEK
ncbi:MAG: prephenate dehydrogenase/arogenate dehydrogenase family protein [Anaerolineae bacterium]|nr:prephenate dehydrogenase/arogenate dehydrogenase family protein [Anaerolineae bacterium]